MKPTDVPHTPNMDRFPTLIMLYATHIIDGQRTIESVPEKIREDVRTVVESALKKSL